MRGEESRERKGMEGRTERGKEEGEDRGGGARRGRFRECRDEKEYGKS